MTGFTDPLGHQAAYAYDTSGTYDTAGHLTQLFLPSHPSNAFDTNYYDSLGRVAQQTDGNGNLTTEFFAGSRTEIDEPPTYTAARHAMYFDTFGHIAYDIQDYGDTNTGYQNDWNLITSYVYEAQERLTLKTMPEGNSVSYSYDQAGNRLTETQTGKPSSGLSRTKYFQYDPIFNKMTTETDFIGHKTGYDYDSVGNLTRKAQPKINSVSPNFTYTYNSLGQMLSETDAVGRVTSYTYNTTSGTLATEIVDSGTGRLNLSTQYGYDGAGNMISQTDPNGNTTTFAYDAARQRTSVKPPQPYTANVTNTSYDPDGRVIAVQRYTGNSSAPWQTTTTAYTLTGKIASVTDPNGDATTYSYDGADRLLTVTDGAGYSTTNCWYDVLDRILSVCKGGPGQPSQTVEFRAYWTNGPLAFRQYIINGVGYPTYYPTDGLDRLDAIVYPDGSRISYGYDDADDITSKTSRAGQTVTWLYDALLRPTQMLGADKTIAYTYDQDGHLLSAQQTVKPGSKDPSGTWSFIYDTAGRRSTDTVPGPTGALSIWYQWDANSNRTFYQVTSGSGYRTFQTAYDQLNRPYWFAWVAHSGLWTDSYDALDRLTTNGYYNGQNGQAATQVNYAYGANATGNDLTGLSLTFGTQALQYTYSYDAGHRLLSTGTNATGMLAHPGAAGGVTYSVTANENQVAGVAGGANFSYDGNGYLASDGVWSYTYDPEGAGRVASASKAGSSVTYGYDPFGQRYSKTVNGTTTIYLSDRVNDEIAEFDGSGNPLRWLMYDPAHQGPSASVDNLGNITYYHADRIGSIIATSTIAGALQSQYSYLPFGESVPLTGAGFGYAGYRYDAETGLYHTAQRYYSPSLGRFLQTDPIGQDGGLNVYAYVANDPLNKTDPTGKSFQIASQESSLVQQYDSSTATAIANANETLAAVNSQATTSTLGGQTAPGSGYIQVADAPTTPCTGGLCKGGGNYAGNGIFPHPTKPGQYLCPSCALQLFDLDIANPEDRKRLGQ